MPERFLEEALAGTAVKLSRPLTASRGFGMSIADLPLRAIPRAETGVGAMILAILQQGIVRDCSVQIMSQPLDPMRDAS